MPKNPDAELIDNCKEIIRLIPIAEDASCKFANALDQAESVFPPCPSGPDGWRYTHGDISSFELRDAINRQRTNPHATKSWFKSMRGQLKAVKAWEMELADIRKQHNVPALRNAEARLERRIKVLWKRIAELSAQSSLALAWKALVIQKLNTLAGYDLNGCDDLICSLLNDCRNLNFGYGNPTIANGIYVDGCLIDAKLIKSHPNLQGHIVPISEEPSFAMAAE